MRVRPAAVVAALSLLPTALHAQRPDRPRRESVPVELHNLTFREEHFASRAIGRDDVPYGIYLPKGYDADDAKEAKWPLVIWLHGMWEDHLRFHGRGVGAPVLDRMVGCGDLPPCVFVLANGGRTSMYINAGSGRDYEDLITKDLLEHLTATWRVSTERSQRALMGISMGGMAALRIGFTHPELFGTIAVHSSAVFPADPKQLPPRLLQRASEMGFDEVFGSPIDEKRWAATNPLGIAMKLDPKALDGLRLYFDAGTEDRHQFHKGNQALHEVLEQRKVPHTWELVQGGGHAWGSGFKESSLEASLRFVGTAFAAAAAKDAGLKGLGGALGGQNGDGKDGKPKKD